MNNMNGMSHINNKFNFHGLKQHAPGPGPDFEARVFAKIRKKKIQRKVTASAALSIALFAFIYIGQAVFLQRDSGAPGGPGERILLSRNGHTQTERIMTEKEEVPVMENVVFASYDRQTDYAIEQVADNEHDTI